MTDKVMIMVAPNGARRTKVDHPHLPITPDEVVEAVIAARDAGAAAAHVHARDEALKHTLDADRYASVLSAVKAAVGDTMVVQMTTEAVGMYSAAEQMAAVRALKPAFASMAIREIVGSEAEEKSAHDFFLWLKENHIVPQFILYDPSDLTNFIDLQNRGIVPFANPYLLFVLGRYTHNQQSSPADLEPYLEILGTRSWPFMLCAFGSREAACMRAAFEAGGHARVGFENNLLLPDGARATSNADLVQAAAEEAKALGKLLMTAEEIREFLRACLGSKPINYYLIQ